MTRVQRPQPPQVELVADLLRLPVAEAERLLEELEADGSLTSAIGPK
jgi:hypothetical protein